jgi:hypothetical protein
MNLFEWLLCPQHGIVPFVIRYLSAVDPQLLYLTIKSYYERITK